MRFYCENACAKQAAKCEFEFIVFTKGTNIVATNFALFIVGHGLEEGLGDLFPVFPPFYHLSTSFTKVILYLSVKNIWCPAPAGEGTSDDSFAVLAGSSSPEKTRVAAAAGPLLLVVENVEPHISRVK